MEAVRRKILGKQANKVILVLSILTMLLFGLLHVDIRKVDLTVENVASEGETLARKGSVSEVVSYEHAKVTILRGAVSRNTNPGNGSYLRNGMEYIPTDAILTLACLCAFLVFLSFRTISYSHRFIMSYIHSLDGKKF